MKRSLLGLVLRLAVAALLAILLCGAAATPQNAPAVVLTATAAQQSAAPAVSLASSSATRAHPGVKGNPSGNPWGYNYSCCRLITHPPRAICRYFHCIPSFWHQTRGYVEQCQDGMISHSGGRRGSCSSHGGNLRPLYRP